MKQLIIIALACVLFSCKKTNETDPVNPGMSTAEGKDWFAKNMTAATTKTKKGIAQPQVLNPRWDRVVQSEDADSYIMELPVDLSTKHSLALSSADRAALPDPDKNTVKFFLVKNKRSNLISPVIMNILGDGKINASDFHYGSAGNNFSGKVFYTTLSGDFIKGTAYTNGKVSGTISPISRNGQALPPNCEETQVGIYSQTCYYYTDGTSECDPEVLLYIITYSVCGSVGGGTTTAPPPPPCEAAAAAFLNAGTAESGPVTATTQSNDGSVWNVVYSWEIFSALSWHLTSYENATLVKIQSNTPDNGLWQFQSFTHGQIVASGSNLGGTRTFADLGATINMTPRSVWEELNFTVTSTVGGCVVLPSVTNTYSTSTTFHAPGNINITKQAHG